MGAADFTLTQAKAGFYMKQFTPAQLDYFYRIPLWAVVTWGAATWGSWVAAGFLLARRRTAAQLYLVSTVCMVITTAYSYGLSDGLKAMGEGATGALIFSAVIFVICVLEVIYSRLMCKRGVLR